MVSEIEPIQEAVDSETEIQIGESSQEPTDDLRKSLLNHLCSQSSVFFKSQQIDDPEITFEQKLQISGNILNSSPSVFLSRFGMYLEPGHLRYFENQNLTSEDDKYIVDFYLRELRDHNQHKSKKIKNRRYQALLNLIKENKYFSLPEMKEREPLLYEQLIGQYKTANEKKLELRPNAKTDTLIDVLFQGIDQDYVADLEKQQREEEDTMNSDDSSMSEGNSESTEENCNFSKEQWGNFDDTDPGPSSRSPPKKTRKQKKLSAMITAAERDLLKDEFLGIMYSNFLCGKDKDFDYKAVDENGDLDNTPEFDQDKEDAYFEGYDSDDAENELKGIAIENGSERMADPSEDEDDLDIYMKHIEQHLKKQDFIEEMDD
jgi:hypothetical protein